MDLTTSERFAQFVFKRTVGESLIRLGLHESGNLCLVSAGRHAELIKSDEVFLNNTEEGKVFTELFHRGICMNFENNEGLSAEIGHHLRMSKSNSIVNPPIDTVDRELINLLFHYEKLKEEKKRESLVDGFCDWLFKNNVGFDCLANMILQHALDYKEYVEICAILCVKIKENQCEQTDKKSFYVEMVNHCQSYFFKLFGNPNSDDNVYDSETPKANFLSFMAKLYQVALVPYSIIGICLETFLNQTSCNHELYASYFLWLAKEIIPVYMHRKQECDDKKTKKLNIFILDLANQKKNFSHEICQQIEQLEKSLTDYEEKAKECEKAEFCKVDDILKDGNKQNKNDSLHGRLLDQGKARMNTASPQYLMLKKRMRQIDVIKADPKYKYKKYIAEVHKFNRQRAIHPRTPNPRKNLSEEEDGWWDQQFANWCTGLKKYANKK